MMCPLQSYAGGILMRQGQVGPRLAMLIHRPLAAAAAKLVFSATRKNYHHLIWQISMTYIADQS
jgi:hypothetical protein